MIFGPWAIRLTAGMAPMRRIKNMAQLPLCLREAPSLILSLGGSFRYGGEFSHGGKIRYLPEYGPPKSPAALHAAAQFNAVARHVPLRFHCDGSFTAHEKLMSAPALANVNLRSLAIPSSLARVEELCVSRRHRALNPRSSEQKWPRTSRPHGYCTGSRSYAYL